VGSIFARLKKSPALEMKLFEMEPEGLSPSAVEGRGENAAAVRIN
jgi:hypothetical protein